MFSFTGETVFDPFLGSGTTIVASQNLSRNSIGYEINPAYLSIIKEKIGTYAEAHNSCNLYFETDNTGWNRNQIDKLPYIFKDYVNINRKTNENN